MARTTADREDRDSNVFSSKPVEQEPAGNSDLSAHSKPASMTMDFTSLLGTKQVSDSRVGFTTPGSPAVPVLPAPSSALPADASASTPIAQSAPRVSFKELKAASTNDPIPPILITASSSDGIVTDRQGAGAEIPAHPTVNGTADVHVTEPPGRPPPSPSQLMEGQVQEVSRDSNAIEAVRTAADGSDVVASPSIASPARTNPAASQELSASPIPASALELRPQTERRADFAAKRPYSFSGAFKDKSSPAKWGGSFSAGTARGDAGGPSGAHLGPVTEDAPPARKRTLGRRLNSGEMFERRLTRQRSEKEVLVGTPVKEGHVNYMLMYDMLTGIRISVSRCNAKLIRPLTDADFTAAHKLAFDVTGNELTPSSKYDFKFKDYAPWVFRMIRESFHVDPAEYLLSLTGKYVLSELGSPGKSGSFFYYSQDYRFIIKTIHHSEHKFMRKILKHYYHHICHNPHTLLSRIFGLHRVKLPGNRKIHFVVMGNVFPANKDIHETYDLKGSLVGRELPEEEAKTNPRAVLKDLNWLKREKHIALGPEKRHIMIEQMERDVEFLKSQMIMDYSLLIGVHDLVKGNKDNIRDQTLAVFDPEQLAKATAEVEAGASAEQPLPQRNSKRPPSKAQAMKRALTRTEAIQLGPSNSRLPDDSPAERKYCVFYQDAGGFQSTDDANLPSKELYYIGIIDIFTRYDFTKRVEHAFKSIGHDKTKISAVHPTLYGNRFVKFMRKAITGGSNVVVGEGAGAPLSPTSGPTSPVAPTPVVGEVVDHENDR
ncbi:Phosphatidylinositol-4-phosphate 5-kinase [Rhizophlyctis rosea]|nr:Phosphatidylinositol-4-phosphate 5-kinase [Rhizophlyctis rosea]